MEPRRKSNKKIRSTSLPKEYLKNVQSVFNQAFKSRLNGRSLYVEGRLFPEELILCVGYKPEPKGLRQINFEASIDHKGSNVFDQLNVCIDAISSMMDQFLESDESLELPIEWTSYKFDKKEIFLRTSGRNTELENEANRLLGVDSNDALYTEGDDELDEIDEEYGKTMKEVDETLRRKKH